MRTERDPKERRYFSLGGGKKVYLGTLAKPHPKNVREAIAYLDGKIDRYTEKRHSLEQLLAGEGEPFQTGFRLVVFDLDEVIYDKSRQGVGSDKTAVSTWGLLFQQLGIHDTHELLRKRFEDGHFKDYGEWADAACGVLKALRVQRQTFESVIPLRPGAGDVLRTLHKSGVSIGVVTSSFDVLASQLTTIAPIRYRAPCSLEFDGEGFLSSWTLRPTDYRNKAAFVHEMAEELSVPKEQRAYVGDYVNDIKELGEVGLSIAFNPQKPNARRAASVVIDSRNLISILPYLHDYDKQT